MEWYVELIDSFIDHHVSVKEQEKARRGVRLILEVLPDILNRVAPLDFKALAKVCGFEGPPLSNKWVGQINRLISDFHQYMPHATPEMQHEILVDTAMEINEVYRNAEKCVSDSECSDDEDVAGDVDNYDTPVSEAGCYASKSQYTDNEDSYIPLSDTECYPSDSDAGEVYKDIEDNAASERMEQICAVLKARITATVLPEPADFLGSGTKLAEIFGSLNHLPAPRIARRLVLLQEQLPRMLSGLYKKIGLVMRDTPDAPTHDEMTQFQLAFLHLLMRLEPMTHFDALDALPDAVKRLAQFTKIKDPSKLGKVAETAKKELLYFRRQLMLQKTMPSFTQILSCCNQLEYLMGGQRSGAPAFSALNEHYEAHPYWKNYRLPANHFLRIFLAILFLQLKNSDYEICCFEMADERLDFLRGPNEDSTLDMLKALEKGALRLLNYQLEPKIHALKAWFAAHPPSDGARESLMRFCNDNEDLHAALHCLLFETESSDARVEVALSLPDETLLQGAQDALSSPPH